MLKKNRQDSLVGLVLAVAFLTLFAYAADRKISADERVAAALEDINNAAQKRAATMPVVSPFACPPQSN